MKTSQILRNPSIQAILRLTGGLLLAFVIIAVGRSLYPWDGGSVGGHVLTVFSALFVGLMVALPPLEPLNLSVPVPATKSRKQDRGTPDESEVVSQGASSPFTTVEMRAFAGKHPVCFLATTENGQPRVRTVVLWFVDDRGLQFILRTQSGTSAQLRVNPKAEVCFYNHAGNLDEAEQLRVRGTMYPVHNEALQKCASKVPLNSSIPQETSNENQLRVYRLEAEEVQFSKRLEHPLRTERPDRLRPDAGESVPPERHRETFTTPPRAKTTASTSPSHPHQQ